MTYCVDHHSFIMGVWLYNMLPSNRHENDDITVSVKSPKTHYDSWSFADFHLLRNEKKRYVLRLLTGNAGACTEHTCSSSHIAAVHRRLHGTHMLIFTHHYCAQVPEQNTHAYFHTSLLCTDACTEHTLLIFTHRCCAQAPAQNTLCLSSHIATVHRRLHRTHFAYLHTSLPCTGS